MWWTVSRAGQGLEQIGRAMAGGLDRLVFPERGEECARMIVWRWGAQRRSLWGHVLVRPSYGDDPAL